MKSSSSRVWLVYALCVAALLGGMTLMTRRALDLERAEREARGKAAVQERIRLALWRMDSSMAAMLARESARPWSHYAAFSPQSPGISDKPEASEKTNEPGALLASPLLTDAPEYARLYLQVMPDGRVSSPQVPEGGQRGMALLADADPKRIDRAALALERVAALVPELRRDPDPTPMLSAGASDAGRGVVSQSFERATEQNPPREQSVSEQAKSQKDLEARQWVLNQAVTGQRANIAQNQGSQAMPGGAPGAPGAPTPLSSAEPQPASLADAAGKLEAATALDSDSNAASAGTPDEKRADATTQKAEAAPSSATDRAMSTGSPDPGRAMKKRDDGFEQRARQAAGVQTPPEPAAGAAAVGESATPSAATPGSSSTGVPAGSTPQPPPVQAPAPPAPAPSADGARAEAPAYGDALSPVPRRSVQLGERLRFGVFDSDANTVVLAPDEPGELIAVCITPAAAGLRDASFAGTPAGEARAGAGGGAVPVESEILLVRDGPVSGSLQGVWLEWPLVRGQLLELISDLLPGSTLEALPRGIDGGAALGAAPGRGMDPVLEAQTLVSVPVRLVVPEATIATMMPPAASMFSSTRLGFVLGWVAIVAAAAAIGLVLRASVELSERRGRFVSAVTHELRTPLTTFRLYSQMLADGMVRDEAARGEYHRTLRSEAERLSRIVESVLDYAKLGKRRPGAMWASVPAHELLERLTPVLAARAEAGGLTLKIEADLGENVTVSADPSAVERIMLNLVENACKYAGSRAARPDHPADDDLGDHAAAELAPAASTLLVLRARAERRRVVLALRDFGPGVPDRERRRIFRPFQRGTGQESGTTPGLGLGLAFSRGLARDMGGDLVLVKPGRQAAANAAGDPTDSAYGGPAGAASGGVAGAASGAASGGAEFELTLARA